MKCDRIRFVHTVRHANIAENTFAVDKARDLTIEIEGPFVRLKSGEHVTVIPIHNVAYFHPASTPSSKVSTDEVKEDKKRG